MGSIGSKNFRYSYEGPVMEFGRVIANRWSGETYATSAQKAASNLAYQFKKQFNRTANTKISLPGKLVRIDGEEKTR